MIDHVYISVTNIERSLVFYVEALKPLGWSPVGNYDSASGPQGVPDLYGVGDDVFGTGRRSAQASGYVNASSARPGSMSGLSATRMNWWTPPTRRRSKQAAPTKVNQQIAPTSPPATTPPTSPTSTATVLSSSTRRGTPSTHSRVVDSNRRQNEAAVR